MKRILMLCGLLATLTFFSCQKDLLKQDEAKDMRTMLNTTRLVLENLCGEPVTKDLRNMYGDFSWGDVVIGNDKDHIIIQINSTQPGMYLSSATISYGTEESVVSDLLAEYFWTPCEGPAVFDIKKTWDPQTKVSDTIRIPISEVLADGCLWLSVNVGLLGEHYTLGCAYVAPSDNQYGSGLWHSAFKYCVTNCPPTECQPLHTQTPGGWGATPRGNNPGKYLHDHFAAAFPDGLQVGCYPGNYYVNLTSAQAITNLLPTGGEAKVLAQNYSNPIALDNVLVGHVVALTLSVGFDEKFEDFAKGSNKLGDMFIASGPFQGWTVKDFLAEANKALGGCGTYAPKDVVKTITAINENYVDGKTDNGFLVCAMPRLQ